MQRAHRLENRQWPTPYHWHPLKTWHQRGSAGLFLDTSIDNETCADWNDAWAVFKSENNFDDFRLRDGHTIMQKASGPAYLIYLQGVLRMAVRLGTPGAKECSDWIDKDCPSRLAVDRLLDLRSGRLVSPERKPLFFVRWTCSSIPRSPFRPNFVLSSRNHSTQRYDPNWENVHLPAPAAPLAGQHAILRFVSLLEEAPLKQRRLDPVTTEGPGLQNAECLRPHRTSDAAVAPNTKKCRLPAFFETPSIAFHAS